MDEYRTEVVRIDDLRPHPRNYRTHPADQLEHLAASIREHGFYRNVVVARDNTILAGHGVVEAARMLGMVEAPVFRADVDPSDPAALRILAADNEIARLAEINDRALADVLRDLRQIDGLLGTGYDDAMLANLVLITRPSEEIPSLDAAAEWAGMPAYHGEREDPRERLTMQFASKEDRDRFVAELGLHVIKGPAAWWPPRPSEDVGSLVFTAGDGA